MSCVICEYSHDFAKSSTRQATKDYFINLVKEKILYGDINIAEVTKELEKFEKYVQTSLMDGEKDFLIPKSIRRMEDYKEPWKNQGWVAALVWNTLEPDNPITENKIDIVKVKMNTLEMCAGLKETNPKVYSKLVQLFNSEFTANKKNGVEVIAIPSNLEKIPDWLMPYIDYNTITHDNISRFHSVLEAMGIKLITTKGGMEHFSNILHI